MDNQPIQFLTTEFKKTSRYVDSQFELRTDRKHVWLQKCAIWILKKLGCYAIHWDTTEIKHTINTDDFARLLWEQKAELFTTYHYKGKRLLVGYEEFQKLQGFPVNHPLSFSCQYMWGESRPTLENPQNFVRKAGGLEVTVIPWMKGFLVLPEDMN